MTSTIGVLKIPDNAVGADRPRDAIARGPGTQEGSDIYFRRMLISNFEADLCDGKPQNIEQGTAVAHVRPTDTLNHDNAMLVAEVAENAEKSKDRNES
jgi:hypothetical protein